MHPFGTVIRVLVVEIVGFGAEGAEKNRISAPKAPKNFRDFGIDLGVGIDLTRLTGIPVTGICDAEHKHLYHLPYALVSCVTILKVMPNRYDIEFYIYFEQNSFSCL